MFSNNYLLKVIILFLAFYNNFRQETSLFIQKKYENGTSVKQDLLSFINEGREKMKSHHKLNTSQVREQIVMVLGMTGSGKSTLINYLNDVPMMFIFDDASKYVVKPVDDGLPGGFEIGHKSESKTFYPAVYSPPDGSFSYVDNPGFDDTRGVEFSIANGFFRKEITESANELKFLLLIQQSDINNKGNDFRKSIHAFSTFLGIFDDKNDLAVIEQNIEELSKSIGIIVTKVDNKRRTNEIIKESLTKSLCNILAQEKERKIEKNESTEIEDVFNRVLVSNQLEIFPGFSNVEEDDKILGSEQKLPIVAMINQKLSFISKEKLKIRTKLENKVDILKTYIDEKYGDFRTSIETILVKKLKDSASSEKSNFLSEKNSKSLVKTIDDFGKILSIINNQNVSLINIDSVLVNFNKINGKILNQEDLTELNKTVNVFRYLIDLLPEKDINRYLEAKILESANLISSINNESYQMNELLSVTINNEKLNFISFFKDLFLNKINEHVTKVVTDFNGENIKELGQMIQNTIDNYDKIVSIIANHNINLNNCDQFLSNITNLNMDIFADDDVTQVYDKLNDLKNLIPPNNQSHLEIQAFDKGIIMDKLKNSSSYLKQKLIQEISIEKRKFGAFLEPFLIEKVESFVSSKISDFNQNGYLDGEQQLNIIIEDFSKTRSLIFNSQNVSFHDVNNLLKNISNINDDILTANDISEAENRMKYLLKLIGTRFYLLGPLQNLINKTNDLIVKINAYLSDYQKRCKLYKEIILYKHYPSATIILKSNCNIYRTLEITSEDGAIIFNDQESTNADNKRYKYIKPLNYSASCSQQSLKEVIDKYRDPKILNEIKSRSRSLHRRCFPNAILSKCGVVAEIVNGMFHCEKNHEECCNFYHTKCCCYNGNSDQVGPYFALAYIFKMNNCYFKYECYFGWKCKS